MAKKDSFWDVFFKILIWLGLVILFVWVILKILGLISSPLFVETIPYLGGFLTLFGIAYQFGRFKQGIDFISRRVNETYNRLSSIEQKFNNLYHEHEIAMGRVKLKKH